MSVHKDEDRASSSIYSSVTKALTTENEGGKISAST